MFAIFALQVIVVIAVGYLMYNKGYSTGVVDGREDERARYKDEIKVSTKEVVED